MSHQPQWLPCLLLAGLLVGAAPVSAEIYKSEDSEGNPVYTDHPQSGGQEVTLPEVNVADEPSPATSPGHVEDGGGDGGGNVVVIPNSHNEALNKKRESERRHTVSDADPRHKVSAADERRSVSDADERRSVSDAEPRKEVRDADPRHEVQDAEPRD